MRSCPNWQCVGCDWTWEPRCRPLGDETGVRAVRRCSLVSWYRRSCPGILKAGFVMGKSWAGRWTNHGANSWALPTAGGALRRPSTDFLRLRHQSVVKFVPESLVRLTTHIVLEVVDGISHSFWVGFLVIPGDAVVLKYPLPFRGETL